MSSNSIVRACFIFLLCTFMTSANKSPEKKKFPLGWKCYKTIGSCVSCAFIRIWSTWEVWRALKKLELFSAMPWATLMHLLCPPNFTRASYLDERNACWRMNQLLNWWLLCLLLSKSEVKNIKSFNSQDLIVNHL